ncbi:MAG: DCC1-like thiol-disulfide oxidoreductase family protein [Candidatus Algichlamydia australiensis]|nr:DCC1-like thiol-disulfide oxidoreductase family protein [Chlamydiales bacterium]
MHLIFFDDQCPLCQRAVAIAKKADRKNICEFHPLASEKAKPYLEQDRDTFILIENGEKKWLYAKGIFRLLWLLGGKWALLGWLYILPKWLIDPIYRFIAKHRIYN